MWGLPFRCKVCPDGIGDSADIAVADAWVGGSPTREGSVDDPGFNACVVRTKAGEELFNAAIEANAIDTENDLVPDEMSIFQPHQMRKKYAVWARYQGLADSGRIVPQTNRLRIEILASELAESAIQYQREGTVRRIQEGKVDLPTPKPAES